MRVFELCIVPLDDAKRLIVTGRTFVVNVDGIFVLNRHFRWSGNPALEGEVAFYIEREGSVGKGSIQVTRKSGDFRFDLEMMSAVEQAGNRRAFGPLPDGWVSDKLWVRFKFLPPS